MIRNLRVRVTKKQILNDRGHFRYYSPVGKKQAKNPPEITISNNPNIKSEKDLVLFIYNKWGAGEYRVYAYAKGIKGLWTFWKGEINEEGFIFHARNYKNKEIIGWEKELKKSRDSEDKEMINEILDEERKFLKEKAKKVRYGFKPFLKKSSNRGEFRFWDQDNLNLKPDPEEIEKQEENKKWNVQEESKLPEWGSPQKGKELPKW